MSAVGRLGQETISVMHKSLIDKISNLSNSTLKQIPKYNEEQEDQKLIIEEADAFDEESKRSNG